MNEIEMNNAGTHMNAEVGVPSIRSTDALIIENGICISSFDVVIDQSRLCRKAGCEVLQQRNMRTFMQKLL